MNIYKCVVAGILLSVFSIGDALIVRDQIAVFDDIFKNRLYVFAGQGMRFCDKGNGTVHLYASDEHDVNSVTMCFSHSEVEQLIAALQKANERF